MLWTVKEGLYSVAQKNWHISLYALTSSNIDRFSNMNQEKICNNPVTKDTTTPQVFRYSTL